MGEGYNPVSFWNSRFNKVGHTGELNPLLYAYDQPQRLRAISQSLVRANICVKPDMNVLDIGCGTGDVIDLLMKAGEPAITGVDISEETIRHTMKRFDGLEKVNLVVGRAEEIDFPAESFDLVIGINILQHLIEDQDFLSGIENFIRVCKPHGHILIMDFSPIVVNHKHPSPYVVYRTRQEYIDYFAERGCSLVSEYGLPRVGVRLYRGIGNVGGRVRQLVSRSRASSTSSGSTGAPSTISAGPSSSWSFGLGDFMRTLVLRVSKPLDYLLAPLPPRFTDMRILIFRVTAR